MLRLTKIHVFIYLFNIHFKIVLYIYSRSTELSLPAWFFLTKSVCGLNTFSRVLHAMHKYNCAGAKKCGISFTFQHALPVHFVTFDRAFTSLAGGWYFWHVRYITYGFAWLRQHRVMLCYLSHVAFKSRPTSHSTMVMPSDSIEAAKSMLWLLQSTQPAWVSSSYDQIHYGGF